jgi:hypothetical protein
MKHCLRVGLSGHRACPSSPRTVANLGVATDEVREERGQHAQPVIDGRCGTSQAELGDVCLDVPASHRRKRKPLAGQPSSEVGQPQPVGAQRSVYPLRPMTSRYRRNSSTSCAAVSSSLGMSGSLRRETTTPYRHFFARSKNLEIRDVPDDVHATLRARAAEAGESLSDYVLHEIERLARRPAIADILMRADRRSRPAELDAESILDAVREAREGRQSA